MYLFALIFCFLFPSKPQPHDFTCSTCLLHSELLKSFPFFRVFFMHIRFKLFSYGSGKQGFLTVHLTICDKTYVSTFGAPWSVFQFWQKPWRKQTITWQGTCENQASARNDKITLLILLPLLSALFPQLVTKATWQLLSQAILCVCTAEPRIRLSMGNQLQSESSRIGAWLSKCTSRPSGGGKWGIDDPEPLTCTFFA